MDDNYDGGALQREINALENRIEVLEDLIAKQGRKIMLFEDSYGNGDFIKEFIRRELWANAFRNIL